MMWFSCIAAGLSFCLLAWSMGNAVFLVRSHAGIRPPGGWLSRLVWPWIGMLLPLVQRLFPPGLRRTMRRTLAAAGLDSSSWTAEHVLALQLLATVSCAGLAALIMLLGLDAGLAKALFMGLLIGLVVAWWPYQRLSERVRKRRASMLRDIPFMLDMATLCVEAGQNLQGALQQAAKHGPPGALRSELQHALADMRAGMPRIKALQAMATRTGLPALQSLVALIAQAEQMGMSMGPLFRAQAEQRRAERFLRAEKLALEAPVKMLLPLVTCIFPCSFLVIAFPIGYRLLQAGF